MSYQQYPRGYGGPSGQPPQDQYSYPPPNYPQQQSGYPQGPPPVPPHPSGFPPTQNQAPYQQSGGAAGSYFNPNSAPPPPGAYGQGYQSQSGYIQPDYNPNRASYSAPQQPPPNFGYPGGYGQAQPGPGAYGGAQPFLPPSQPFNSYGAPPNAPYSHNPQYQPQRQQSFPGQHPPAFGVPSPGYEEPPQCNPAEYGSQADALRKAMKGLGTDESTLIRVLAQLQTPYAVHSVQRAFTQIHKRDLVTDIKKETSGNFRDALLAVARGPLMEEVYALHDAIHRPGTTESVLDDVLLCRSPPDLDAIKKAYKRTFSKDLETDVRGDLSMKTENMFVFALENRRADESVPVDIGQSEKDAYNIQMAMEGVGTTALGGVFGGTHQEAVYSTILSRNYAQIGAIALSYERMYNRRLDAMIEKKFTGHMEQALLYAIRGGTDKALRDATLLEDAMKGLGTKDSLLIHRIVKLRWNKAHFENVKRAYRDTYRQKLEDRVYGETSGDYRKFLTALIVS